MARKTEGFPQINLEAETENLETNVALTEAEQAEKDRLETEKKNLITLFTAIDVKAVDILNFEDLENAVLKYEKDGVIYEVSLRLYNMKTHLLQKINELLKNENWLDAFRLLPNLYFEILETKGQIYISE